jgi:hypothetical protein
MREDMAKVIVERPRTGGKATLRGEKRRLQRLDPDEWERHESIRERWTRSLGYDRKQLNENLNPLERFLASKIGKRWNDVFSEISERINRNSAVQLHIWQHIEDYVELDVILVDGVAKLNRSEYRFLASGEYSHISSRFYVNPITGILCDNEKYRSWRHRGSGWKHQDPYTVVDGKYYRKVDNLWYEFELKPVPDCFLRKNNFHLGRGYVESVFDHFLRHHYTKEELSSLHSAHGRPNVYAGSKRQAGKKEIKRIKYWMANQNKKTARVTTERQNSLRITLRVGVGGLRNKSSFL